MLMRDASTCAALIQRPEHKKLTARPLSLLRASPPFDISRESTGSAHVCVVLANDAEVSRRDDGRSLAIEKRQADKHGDGSG
jgi:hypothetical protein